MSTLALSDRRRAVRGVTGMFGRDALVAVRDVWGLATQSLLQPVLTLIVFGMVLDRLGFVAPAYRQVLLPGTVAMTVFATAIATVAMPLVLEFAYTREIDDRLTSPVPTGWLAVEKVLFGAAKAAVSGLLMIPIGMLLLGSSAFPMHAAAAVVGVLLLTGLAGAAVGLSLGTLVGPARLPTVFSAILTPIFFTGCSQYPWASLTPIPVFKWAVLANPLSYASESVRGLVLPGSPHLAVPLDIVALVVVTLGFGALGVRGFNRRAGQR